MKWLFITTSLIWSLGFTLTNNSFAAQAVSEIPFSLEKGHIIVPAKIQGDMPVEVTLSTGIEHSLINALVLKKYKLRPSYTGEGIITGGNLDRVVYFVAVSDIKVGDAPSRDLNMKLGSQSLDGISHRVGREIFGILGVDFFKGRQVQFDFRRKLIRFLPEPPAKSVQSADPSLFVTLPMRPTDRPIRLPIAENVSFNGKKIKTLFDTGALTVISLTTAAAKQIGVSVPRDKSSSLTNNVSVELEKMSLGEVPATVHSKGSGFDRDSEGYGAVVGIALLQNFIITFDFKDGAVTLERM